MQVLFHCRCALVSILVFLDDPLRVSHERRGVKNISLFQSLFFWMTR